MGVDGTRKGMGCDRLRRYNRDANLGQFHAEAPISRRMPPESGRKQTF